MHRLAKSAWLALCGFGLAGAGLGQRHQDRLGGNFEGWIFDQKSMAASLPPLKRGRGQGAELWNSVWSRALRDGPRVSSLIVNQLDARTLGYRLALIAAVGISGGRSAQVALEKRLKRPLVDEVVFACLAAGGKRVCMPPEKLLQAGSECGRPQVVRLAAKLAVIASGSKVEPAMFARALRDDRIDRLLNAIFLTVHSDVSAAELNIPVLSKRPPVADSLEELHDRALLLLAAARPKVSLSRSDLERVLGENRSDVVHTAASLALGAQIEVDDQAARALSNLDLSTFIGGLQRASPKLTEMLLEGPGAARPPEFSRRWWAAAARLVPAKRLDELARGMLQRSAEERDAGVRALCHRLLLEPEWKVQAPKLRTLLAGQRFAGNRCDVVLEALATSSLPDRASGVLGSRAAHALELFITGRLATSSPGQVLWRHLERASRVRTEDGPGSREALMLEALNQLVQDIFVGGSRAFTTGRGDGSWLPNGFPDNKEDFVRVLREYLPQFPLFTELR